MTLKLTKTFTHTLGLLIALSLTIVEVQAQSGRNPYRPADGLQAGSGPGLN